jgi:hypothetical protein
MVVEVRLRCRDKGRNGDDQLGKGRARHRDIERGEVFWRSDFEHGICDLRNDTQGMENAALTKRM